MVLDITNIMKIKNVIKFHYHNNNNKGKKNDVASTFTDIDLKSCRDAYRKQAGFIATSSIASGQ